MTEIKLRPVMGWTIQNVNNVSLLLRLVTVGSEAEIDGVVDGRATPEVLASQLTPEQCLDLSDALRRRALAMMAKRPPAASGPHYVSSSG